MFSFRLNIPSEQHTNALPRRALYFFIGVCLHSALEISMLFLKACLGYNGFMIPQN
jgi:hypothetical protein